MDQAQVLSHVDVKKPRFFYGYIIVAAGFLVLVVMGGSIYGYTVFLKPIAADFGWSRAVTSGAFSLCMFLEGIFFIATGRLTDRFGPRKVLTVSGLILGLGFFMMSRSSELWHLYLFYGVVVSMGLSGGFVPLISTIARWFIKRRGLMTGIVVSGIGAGTMIYPPIATWLISLYEWRTAYLILGIVAMVILVVAAQFLKRDPGQVGLTPYGESEVKQESQPGEASGISLREALHTHQFWLMFAIFGLFLTSEMAVMVHMVPHITDQGISPVVAANIMTVIGALSLAGRIATGSIADRIGIGRILVITLILMSVTLFWLSASTQLWMIYLVTVIFGFASGGLMSLESPVIAESFGLKSLGAIVGVCAFANQIGCAVGPLLAGYLFDMTQSYQLAFIIFGSVSVVALLLTVPLIKSSRKAMFTARL